MLKKKIAIIGYGIVGRNVYDEMKSCNRYEITIIDPKRDDYLETINRVYDFGFVCVPTDMKTDGACDTSIVEKAICDTNCQLYIVKSTVPPGTCDELAERFNKRIVFSPEYYGLTKDACRHLGFVILGGEPYDINEVAKLYSYSMPGNFRVHFTSRKTAELVKYMLNSFLAMKVTFCNEFATLAKSIGVNYPELRELFILDERIGSSHTLVYDEQPFYDSHCFNKDIPAIIKYAEELKIQIPILSSIYNENTRRKHIKN